MPWWRAINQSRKKVFSSDGSKSLGNDMKRSKKQIEDKFFQRYGRAMAEWAAIEFILSLWFASACDPRWKSTTQMFDVFYSARSFNGNSDMLMAAVVSSGQSEDLKNFFRKALNHTKGYYQFRNILAHRLPLYLEERKHMILRQGGGDLTVHEGITDRDIVVATRNFRRLYQVWERVRPSRRQLPGRLPSLTLAEGLRRIEELPAEANSSVLSRKQRGKQQQRLRQRA
jgi:hypothetical protein